LYGKKRNFEEEAYQVVRSDKNTCFKQKKSDLEQTVFRNCNSLDIIVVDGELCKKIDVGFRHTKLKNKFVVCNFKNTFDSKLPYYYKTKHKN